MIGFDYTLPDVPINISSVATVNGRLALIVSTWTRCVVISQHTKCVHTENSDFMKHVNIFLRYWQKCPEFLDVLGLELLNFAKFPQCPIMSENPYVGFSRFPPNNKNIWMWKHCHHSHVNTCFEGVSEDIKLTNRIQPGYYVTLPQTCLVSYFSAFLHFWHFSQFYPRFLQITKLGRLGSLTE